MLPGGSTGRHDRQLQLQCSKQQRQRQLAEPLHPGLELAAITTLHAAQVVNEDADREEDDCDDEPIGDEKEPSLGSVGVSEYAHQGRWAAGARDDREHDNSDDENTGDDEPGVDDEPSLGARENHHDQRGWGYGTSDLEQDADDDEPSPRTRRKPRPAMPSTGAPLPAEAPVGTIQIDFPTHPEAVACNIRGGCLAPVVCDGDVVIAEPVLPKPGELAVVWPVEGTPLIKYLTTSLDYGFPHSPKSNVALLIRLRMLNPPTAFFVRADKVERIWRVVRIIPAAEVKRTPNV